MARQWRVSKSRAREITEAAKRRFEIIKELTPVIMTPDGRDSRCASGTHKFSGVRPMGQYKRKDGSWVEKYLAVCPICGAIKCDDDGKPLEFDGKQCRERLGEINLPSGVKR